MGSVCNDRRVTEIVKVQFRDSTRGEPGVCGPGVWRRVTLRRPPASNCLGEPSDHSGATLPKISARLLRTRLAAAAVPNQTIKKRVNGFWDINGVRP
jgi:hypothetical protein